MRTRPGTMLAIALILAASAVARARTFNITYFSVPLYVPITNGDAEAKIECGYEANFTVLSWFKGSQEFFTYRPGTAPSTNTYPVLGVGSVEVQNCGPELCSLKLGSLTPDASGLYRCDIERDIPPFKFASRAGHMAVFGNNHRTPSLEGLDKEYGEGDIIKAYCRTSPGFQTRWYINGKEQLDMRGMPRLLKLSTQCLFEGKPLQMVVKCDGYIYNVYQGSAEKTVMWNALGQRKVRNASCVDTGRLALVSILYFLVKMI